MSRTLDEITRDLDQLDADLKHLGAESSIRNLIEGRVSRTIQALKEDIGENDEVRMMTMLCCDNRDCVAAQLRLALLGN